MVVAKELGVDEATVRSRMKRWKDSGFLVDYSATVGAPLHGHRACQIRFDVPESVEKSETIEKIRLIDGVYRIKDYLGRGLAVSLFFKSSSEMERRVGLAIAVTQARGVVRAMGRAPPPARKPNATDMLVLGAIGWSSRKSYTSIAKETGLSTKTVRKRLEAMNRASMLDPGIFLDYRALSGTLVADLLVLYGKLEDKETVDGQVLSIIGEKLLLPVYSLENAGTFRCVMKSVAEHQNLIDRVKGLKGVSAAYLDIVVEDFYVVETFYRLEQDVLDEVASRQRLSPKTLELWNEGWKVSTDQLYPRGWGGQR